MPSPLPQDLRRVADLRQDKPVGFELAPSAEERGAIAEELELIALKKLSFKGALDRVSDGKLTLTATLGATVVQPCVICLDPVTTRVEADVTRTYLADLPEIELDEIEMPEDDAEEPMPLEIDLAAVMIEALALNLPLYPKAEGAELGDAVYAEPGVQPMRDEDAKPFAGLKDLRAAMDKPDPDDTPTKG